METRRHPAVVIDPAVPEHLEILRGALTRPIGVERVRHRHPIERHLLDAVHPRRHLHPSRLENRRHEIDHMMELRPQTTSGDPRRPLDRHRVARPTEMRGHLLHPLERRVQRPGPPHVEMVLASRRAEIVHVGEQPLRILMHPVLERRRAPGPMHRALSRRPVVPRQVDDQRVAVIGASRVDHPADVMIGVSQEPGETLHQPRRHRPIALRILVPGRDLTGTSRRHRARGDHPEIELAGVDRGSQLIPATVEGPGEPVDPLEGSVMRGVHRRGREITEPRTMRGSRPLTLHPLDRPIGQILIQVIALATEMRRDRCGLVVDRRLELRRLRAEDPVETIEAHPRRPTIERPGWALLP